MSSKALEMLEKGLAVLQKQVQLHKQKLELKSSKGKLSEWDEEWLDTTGNLVDEVYVIDFLKNAPSYEVGLQALDAKYKGVVDNLLELAGPKKVTQKRKCPAGPETATQTRTRFREAKPIPAKKENATLAQRIEILDWHNANGQNQTKTAREFNKKYPNLQLKQPLISSWVKDEAMWREKWTMASNGSRTSKRIQQTQHPEVTQMMELWVLKAMEDKILLTGEVLRQKWTVFANLLCVPNDERLGLSEGWLEKFKARNGLKQLKCWGEAGSADLKTVKAEQERVWELIKVSGYALHDIFNMDETGLFYGLPPDRGLATKRQSGIKGSKVRLTYVFTSNADGTEKLPPLILGKVKKPRAFGGKTAQQLGFLYRNNANAWMTAELYKEWIENWDRELCQKQRKILLFQDNFSGHIVPAGLQNIQVENFAANLTAHVQPNDQGIIRCFKAHYRSTFIQRAVDRYDGGITPSDIYNINQLEAMRIASAAWYEVDVTTIRHCWRKAGILPDAEINNPPIQPFVSVLSLLNDTSPPLDPILRAEKQVEDALDMLVSTGALQSTNRLGVEDLLDLEREQNLVQMVSDEDIFRAVMDAQKADECSSMDGGHDDSDSNNKPEPPLPSRREVIQAVSLITRHTNSLDGASARKIESLLSSLCRDMRSQEVQSLESSQITDFFSRR